MKKGFTLVELLAVIAILAILVIIALPNVMGMFNTAKENSFKTEVKEIYKVAQQTWMQDSMFKTDQQVYSRCDSGCSNSLDLSGRSDLQYCIKINKAGEVTEYYATDGTFQYSFNNSNGLKIEEIKDVQKVSGNNISLTCDGIISDSSVTPDPTPEPDEPVNENNALYFVFKRLSENSTLVKEFTGAHMDSMNTSLSNKNIYYWFIPSGSNPTSILEQNNVIFAGFCWQMIRTTDTGGVKIIYNGVPNNGQCNNTGNARRIGTSSYNSSSNSPAYVGYMYNKTYNYSSKGYIIENLYNESNLSTNHWYGDSVTWDASNNVWILNNPQKISKYNNLSGKYTFLSSNETYSSSTVNYVTANTTATVYYLPLSNGQSLDDINTNTYTYGSNYTTNANGTYTISSPTTILPTSYYSNYNNIKNKYVCKNAVNNTCNEIFYVTNTYSYSFNYISSARKYIYANGFNYNSSTGKYKLNNDRVTLWDLAARKNDINTHHYTCFSDSDECSTISYVYALSSNYQLYYINLINGNSITDALNEMLYADNVNTTNSNIKTKVENWYRDNMTDYTSYLEDIIFCNDRTQRNASVNGFNPNGGDITSGDNEMLFAGSEDLSCSRVTDRFSVSNPKAKLEYPVGLISMKDLRLSTNQKIFQSENNYWTMSPSNFNNHYTVSGAVISFIYNSSTGSFAQNTAGTTYDVRPVVSLKYGTEYSSGNGSKETPYIVE